MLKMDIQADLAPSIWTEEGRVGVLGVWKDRALPVGLGSVGSPLTWVGTTWAPAGDGRLTMCAGE